MGSPVIIASHLFQVGITTVVKLASGAVSYWALAHCGKQPDFHLRESFIADV